MKRRIYQRDCWIVIATLSLLLSVWILGTGKFYALNPQEEQQASSIASAYARFGEEHAYNLVIAYKEADGVGVSSAVIQKCVDAGAFPNYVDDLKALGYTDVDYSAVSGSSGGSSTSAPAESASGPVPEPTAFTVEDMEDTPMWATQVVNYREGASSDYNKLGSLDQYEQVIVNGVASTGWYRFNTAEGTVAYVSNNYLTTEDPSNRELNIYNKETDQVDTYIFEDTDPEAIDEVIEDIKEEYAEKEPIVEEKPEEVVEPEPIVEDEPVEMADEAPVHSWQFYVSIVFAVICVIVIVVCIYYVVRNKKRGRVD